MDDEPRVQQISMSRIPIRGGIGALALIAILVAGVLAELPQLRWRFLGGAALGMVFAVALILWRRRTMDRHTLPPGAHTMFGPEPVISERARPLADETREHSPITRPGAHPRVAPAS
jgi:hypothetical protein